MNTSRGLFSGDTPETLKIRSLLDLLDIEIEATRRYLPASAEAWRVYAQLLAEGRRNPDAPVSKHLDLVRELELVEGVPARRGRPALYTRRIVPGPDDRAALWVIPDDYPQCDHCGLPPDACRCDVPAFDTLPTGLYIGSRYTCNVSSHGPTAIIRREADGAEAFMQGPDDLAILGRDIMALQQHGHDDEDIADEIGEIYDHIMEKED